MINIDALNDDEKLAALESIHKSIEKSKEIQKKKITTNVELIVKALKKIEADLQQRYDETGKLIANLKNGEDGRDGKDGKDGRDGKNGRDGAIGPRGYDGIAGRNGADGQDGVSVVDAQIDFDGSLTITLSNGNVINAGEIVNLDLAEKIKVITNGGGTSQFVLDALASLEAQISQITSGLEYQGTWNASTNVPTLASSVGTAGYYYIVATAGSTNLNGVTDWQIGDWAVFNGTVWQKIDQTNLVTSVAGRTGAIVLTTADIGGLGTMSTQAASNVAITGGSIAGITDLAIADGGTGASTAPNARTNLGLVIGTDVLSPTGSAASLTSFPTFNQNTTGTASNVTGTVAIANGGTGQTTAAAAITALTGTQTSGRYLRSDGTNAALAAIVAGDVPTLNQNTTGTAANVTGTVAIANGGTGATTAGAARTALGATTVGANVFTLTNPSAVTFPRFNADNTVSALDAATFRTAIGAGTSSTTGTVTSVAASVPTFLSISGSPITSSGTLAITLSGTALPVANGGTGITSFGTGVATFLGTPSSANLASAVTDETGSGSLVFATSPTLVTPLLGTPTSGNFSTGTFTWPTFNQNTTGTASNVTGTVAIANGGTGLTTTPANGALDIGNGTGFTRTTLTAGTGVSITNASGSITINATGTGGTVTSVAASVPTFLSVTGSPITTSGTLAISLSGTALPTTSGGTGLTSFTSGGVVYASSTSALATGSALTFNGTTLTTTILSSAALSVSNNASAINLTNASYGQIVSTNTLIIDTTAGDMAFRPSATEGMRLTSTGLGIGTSSPAYKLDVAGSSRIGASGASTALLIGSDATTTGGLIFSDGTRFISGSIANNPYLFYVNNTEQMRLTSTGLGIGTSSPAYKLDVNTVGGSIATARLYGNDQSNVRLRLENAGSGGRTWEIVGGSPGANNANFSIRDVTGSTTPLTIDSSGNLGLGVTPSAWATLKAIEIAGAGNTVSGNGTSALFLSNNAYFNSSWKYANSSAAASQINISSGGIAFNTAPSGTAGNAITFTQAMTLDANGVLIVGATSSDLSGSSRVISVGNLSIQNGASTGTYLQVVPNTANGSVDIKADARTGNYPPMKFWTSATERMVLDASGNLGLGVTPSAWQVNNRALQLLEGWASISANNSQGCCDVAANCYNTGSAATSGWRYTNSYSASLYQQTGGEHKWLTAASGTAGNAITFTQAMTLDASGNLIVGGTSPVISGAGRGNITINGTSTAVMALSVGGSAKAWVYHDNTNMEINAGTTGAMIMYTANTERARIDSSGNFMVGTTSAPNTNAKVRSSTGIQYNNTVLFDVSSPNGKVFTITGGSNGLSTFVEIEIMTYQGYFKAMHFCANASGNWEIDTFNQVTAGTTPTVTVAGSGTATITLTVACTTSYSPIMRVSMGTSFVSMA